VIEEAHMARHMSDQTVESTVNELVKAEEEGRAARADLDRFEADYGPPDQPQVFVNLGAFIEYHRRLRWYREEVEKREKRVTRAEERFSRAAERLQDVLPENVPLNYGYAGGGSQQRYIIVKRQGDVVIEGGASSPGP
jgi:hypothetical protein